jgi:cytochrome b6
LTWVSGYLLFALTLGFGFSGYLLPWNKLSYFATAVGTSMARSVPGIGGWLLQVLRGGQDVTINTLHRFFAIHVVLLPLAFVGWIALHLLCVQRQGMAVPLGAKTAPRGMKFFPSFALRDLLLWLACLMILLVLSVFLPYGPGIPGLDWELGQKADPFAPAYAGIKPEWYFLWEYQLLKEFPPRLFGLEGPQVCLLLVSVLLGIWALIPWLDRRAARDQPSPGFSDFGWGAILFLTFLTLKGWDIGATGLPDAPAGVRAAAWTCAWWTLGLGVAVGALRWVVHGHGWFFLSGAALLQAALHGLFGVSYLVAGVLALGVVLVALGTLHWRKTGARNKGGAA